MTGKADKPALRRQEQIPVRVRVVWARHPPGKWPIALGDVQASDIRGIGILVEEECWHGVCTLFRVCAVLRGQPACYTLGNGSYRATRPHINPASKEQGHV